MSEPKSSLILNTRDYDPVEEGQRILAVGNYGMGKTYFLGLLDKRLKQLGHEKGLLILDFDRGVKTLKSAGFEVDYIKIPKPKAHNDHRSFLKAQKVLRALAEREMLGYAGLGVDSYTTLVKHFECAVHHDSTTKRRLASLGLDLSNENDWGAIIQTADTFLYNIAALSEFGHIVVTIHVKQRDVKVDNKVVKTELLPMVPGKSLPYSIGRFFNEVWHFCKNPGPEGSYFIETVQYEELRAKTQTNLPSKLSINKALDLCFPLTEANRERKVEQDKSITAENIQDHVVKG